MNDNIPAGLTQLGFGTRFQDNLCRLLEGIQMFSDLTSREIEVLAHYVGAYEAPPQTEILIEGGRDNFLCLIAEGSLEVLKEQSVGDRRRLALIRAGKAIGEMAFIDHQPHSASVVTITDTTLLLLTENAFARLSEDNPRLALKLLWKLSQTLSHRLRQTSGKLVDFL